MQQMGRGVQCVEEVRNVGVDLLVETAGGAHDGPDVAVNEWLATARATEAKVPEAVVAVVERPPVRLRHVLQDGQHDRMPRVDVSTGPGGGGRMGRPECREPRRVAQVASKRFPRRELNKVVPRGLLARVEHVHVMAGFQSGGDVGKVVQRGGAPRPHRVWIEEAAEDDHAAVPQDLNRPSMRLHGQDAVLALAVRATDGDGVDPLTLDVQREGRGRLHPVMQGVGDTRASSECEMLATGCADDRSGTGEGLGCAP
ncbi:hypothetical protein H257_06347 [Aphanomyces astaci]|uniref:Uncharacterized protein n=1 Tax=Aphanomyces astaci TaxID=112090 RepID=W4GPT8_APHAT|nr:hypothetical protein H257_06347 [Aphanomyces astaci]ETV80893.1 hypothetical protein H257_06347 [Aphanomyces astaci]|eukprot:XP_009829840.1 hypothetical protein H257_06347 [Aphanomyces astaci]